jgi:glyoxylase-like metal-dependent hydrolase (beta-lactamase superfamily II)
MEEWNVKILSTGKFEIDKSLVTANLDVGTKMSTISWVVAVWNGDKKILIDTGVKDPEWVTNVYGLQYFQDENERLEIALKKYLDWSVNDVDIVINTHLHFDHCGNNHLFNNAMCYVQKREFESAFCPPVSQKMTYARELYDAKAVNYFNWVFTDGEEEILPGIKVILTPGHTDGHQSVLINTEEGVLCVAGDISNLAENLLYNLLPGIITNVEDVLASLHAIRIRSEYFIAAHDPALINLQSEGFPSTQSV